ncbi:hypothetical protein LguiB_035453 [Lonicera macranthoides]
MAFQFGVHFRLDVLVDKDLKNSYDKIELKEMVRVALFCTQYLLSHRPKMSEWRKQRNKHENSLRKGKITTEHPNSGRSFTSASLGQQQEKEEEEEDENGAPLGDTIGKSSGSGGGGGGGEIFGRSLVGAELG